MQKQSESVIIHTSNAAIQLIDSNTCNIRYAEGVLLELEDFMDTQSVFEELSLEKPLKVLFEFPMYTTATYQARMFAQDSEVDAIASAIVFRSLAQRILLRSYYLFHKQKHPVKIFTNREEALIWLDTF